MVSAFLNFSSLCKAQHSKSLSSQKFRAGNSGISTLQTVPIQ